MNINFSHTQQDLKGHLASHSNITASSVQSSSPGTVINDIRRAKGQMEIIASLERQT